MNHAEFYNTVTNAVKAKMADERLSLRGIEEQTGVGHTTVRRAITGRDVALANLLTLAAWAGLDVWIEGDPGRLPATRVTPRP